MAVASVVFPAEENEDMDNPFQKELGFALDSPHSVSE